MLLERNLKKNKYQACELLSVCTMYFPSFVGGAVRTGMAEEEEGLCRVNAWIPGATA